MEKVKRFRQKKRSLFFSYAKGSCDWISENADTGCYKGEKDKEQGDGAKCTNCKFFGSATNGFRVEQTRFIEICDGGRDEKNDDVDPIGGFPDRAVVGVEEDRNERKPQKDAAQLDAPKVRAVAKGAAL